MKNIRILTLSILLFLGIATTAKSFHIFILPYTIKNYTDYFLQGKEAIKKNGATYYVWKDLGDIIQKESLNCLFETPETFTSGLFHEKTMNAFFDKIISSKLQIFPNFAIYFLEIEFIDEKSLIKKRKNINPFYSNYRIPLDFRWIKGKTLLDFYKKTFIYRLLEEKIDSIEEKIDSICKNLREKQIKERKIITPQPQRLFPPFEVLEQQILNSSDKAFSNKEKSLIILS